jgi:hypothetical protein
MSKAENFTVRMGTDLKQRMKDHPEINWSHVIREHVNSMLDDIEEMNQLASNSQLTDDDIDDLADMINAAATERAREDLETGETADNEEPSRQQDRTNLDA